MAIKSKRSFHASTAIEQARTGQLKGAALRKAIETAEDFGNSVAAAELRTFLVEASRKRPKKVAGTAD